jgi:hypothetical protein
MAGASDKYRTSNSKPIRLELKQMLRGLLLSVFCVCTVLSLRQSSAQVNKHEASEVWFSPQTKEVLPGSGKIDYSAHDFTEFLKPNAPWQQAASRTAVVILPGNVVWSYPDRQALVHFFEDHHFKVGFSLGMLSNGGACPVGVEGISKDPDFNHEAVAIARLWKEANGRLDVVAMDAPLGYGHFLEPKCRMPVSEVARRAAATLSGIRSYFPNVQIMDAEGTGRLENPVWFKMMDAWFSEFYRQSGQHIDMVALDLHWNDLRPGNSLEDTSRRAAAFFQTRNIRTGLIINSNERGPSVTDAQWMEANRRHIRHAAKLDLDFLFIASWMGHPHNNLPDSDPIAYTSLVNFAFQVLRPPH